MQSVTWPMWMRIASRIASKLSCAEEESEGRFLLRDTRTTKSWATAFRSNDASFFPPLLFQEKNMRPWGTPSHETSANLAYYFVWWFFVNSLSELMLTTISSVISAGCSTLSRAHDTWSWPSDSLEANRFPQIAQHSIHIIEGMFSSVFFFTEENIRSKFLRIYVKFLRNRRATTRAYFLRI